MRAHELIDLLSKEPQAIVRVSLAGEQPLVVRAVAFSDDVVLLAVPDWKFSELDDALAALARHNSRRPWEAVWQRKLNTNGGHVWQCREHEKEYSACEECKLIVEDGFHWGASERASRFCNCHCKAECPDGVEDTGEA